MAVTKQKLTLVMDMIDRVTTPIQKVTESTKQSATAIGKYQKEISSLNKQSNNLEAFTKLKKESQETSRELTAQQQKVNDLARAISATTSPTRAMTAEFTRAKKEAQALARKHEQQAIKLVDLRSGLSKAGIDTRKLRQETTNLANKTKTLNAEMIKEKAHLQEIAEREQKLNKIRSQNSDLTGKAAMGAAKVGAAVFAIKQLTDSYGEVATAQGQIESLGVGSKGIEQITKAAKDFSNQWSGTTTADFITASYDIKSGISSLSDTAVGEFTKIAALTGKATKSSTAEMTSLFASGYGIYRKQFEQFGKETIKNWGNLSEEEKDIKFGEYLSAGIANTVKAFKTNGTQVADSISALGATATAANIPFSEQLSIMGQLQATMSGSEAATKYKAFLGSAAGAADKLGLNFLNANNQLLSMPDILTELKGRYGNTIDALEQKELKDAFGTDEAMALILQLYPEIDKLKTNINDMGGALKNGTSLTQQMAEAMNRGTNESLILMGQRIGNLTAALGKAFAPVLGVITELIGQAAMAASKFADKCPIVIQLVGGLVVGLITMKTAIIAAQLAQMAMNLVMMASIQKTTMFIAAQKALAVATKVMTGIQWALNAAFTASPIGFIIVSIGALCALAAMLVDDWTPVKNFFSELWGGALSAINALLSPLDTLKNIWSSIFGDDEPATKAIDISKTVQTSFSGNAGYGQAARQPHTPIAANTGSNTTNQNSYAIAVTQQPGENGDGVAIRVRQEIEKMNREKSRVQRSANYDVFA